MEFARCFVGYFREKCQKGVLDGGGTKNGENGTNAILLKGENQNLKKGEAVFLVNFFRSPFFSDVKEKRSSRGVEPPPPCAKKA